ncbi:hypothetical protein GCM10010168_84760 [Actinoplanes ianthinogenes]|uniref:Co/Zn/Cd efflux system component n=1 Tax=Actinoplanes ianthinogenes TaxID=122358 RepID=A0ABM7M061_9ACTN|nr:hypothetical protein Aiant_56070 [Actinoplanes ianthinogenes]GGR52791.1 hypothetical protein GCM10010168_84760 [Actinoplanes ianthinogenes]
MHIKPVVGVICSLVLIAVVSVIVVLHQSPGGIKLPRIGPECTVRADGEVTLDSVQMANAATIAAVGIRREMPEQALVVALATALQESKLENLDDGDRDSVGLFQQRPSQGWGTIEQIKNPRYAAGKFYTALKKVKGWQDMRVTDAAQRVQRSAYPNAYEKWADESRVLARALMGKATGAVECTVSGAPVVRGAAAAAALLEGLKLDWGKKLDYANTEAAGLTVAVSNPSSGWRYAHWLVSHASATGLERVRFGDLEWHAPDGKWQQVTTAAAADDGRVVAEVFS